MAEDECIDDVLLLRPLADGDGEERKCMPCKAEEGESER
jgi:hypothetical protein